MLEQSQVRARAGPGASRAGFGDEGAEGEVGEAGSGHLLCTHWLLSM